jgi:signal transduction histidine kinase
VLLALLVALPPVALGLLGLRAARSEEARLERELASVLRRKLGDLAAVVAGAVGTLEADLLRATERLPSDADELRALGRRDGRLRRLLLLDGRGRLLFPPLSGPTTDEERRLIERSRLLWERGPLAHPPRDEATGRAPAHGWHGAGWEDHLGPYLWRRDAAGRLVAIEVSGMLILSTVVARLPTTPVAPEPPERIALLDAGRRVVYQWGTWAATEGAAPVATVALAAPLDGWQLAYLGPPPAVRGAALAVVAAVAALALALAGVGLVVARESSRELRMAAKRVSFANQVSHELKTPLTNIRLYAEMLEDHLPPDDETARRHLGVVVDESRRLGRLINNILALSRKEKGKLSVHPAPGSIDDVVRDVVGQFRPALEAREVRTEIEAAAPAQVLVDADALSQMLGNLLSNVEKYAPGCRLAIGTAQGDGRTTILFRDTGPGIPPADLERVFEPFVRLGGDAHEAVPGTGIGLGIARDLARLHGGDLRALPAPAGACFELTLRTELVA